MACLLMLVVKLAPRNVRLLRSKLSKVIRLIFMQQPCFERTSAPVSVAWSGAMQTVFFLATVAVLCAAGVLNRYPFFYADTPTYIRAAELAVIKVIGAGKVKPWVATSDVAPGSTKPKRNLQPLTSVDDKVVLSGRSVYYGALLYATYLGGSLWLAIAAQALAVAYLLYLLLVRIWKLKPSHLLWAAATLSLFTPLGVYTGFLMPDIFAPIVVLCIAMLAVYWRELPNRHRWGAAGLLLFGVVSHSSHLVLAGLMLALLFAARLLRRRAAMPWAAIAVVAACVAGGVAAEWAFQKAVLVAVGAPPLRLPHPMAHLIDMGPGTNFLKQRCPSAGYAACAYVDRYPTGWEDFLFSTDPAKGVFALADLATKRRLSDEQVAFFLDVARFDPVGVMRGLAENVVEQLASFRVDLWGYGTAGPAKWYEGRVPPDVYEQMQKSSAAKLGPFNAWQSAATYAAVAASVIFLLWPRRSIGAAAPLPSGFAGFGWLVFSGIAGNAVICAVLASPLDRFQARVAWLLPLLAIALLSYRWRTASQRPSATDVTPPGGANHQVTSSL